MMWWSRSVLAAALVAAVAAGSAPAAPAQDSSQVLKDRQALMKRQAKDLGTIKAYFTGKGDRAAAEAAAAGLGDTMQKIPDLFPPGSAGTSPDGKYAAKPAIWTQWDKFLAARKNAAAKVDVLRAAIKSGDTAQIETAFADLGKNGCGGCHETFREKLTH